MDSAEPLYVPCARKWTAEDALLLCLSPLSFYNEVEPRRANQYQLASDRRKRKGPLSVTSSVRVLKAKKGRWSSHFGHYLTPYQVLADCSPLLPATLQWLAWLRQWMTTLITRRQVAVLPRLPQLIRPSRPEPQTPRTTGQVSLILRNGGEGRIASLREIGVCPVSSGSAVPLSC